MQQITDQQYLVSEQYANAGNLSARIQLHERFSTNTYGWLRWVFDHFDLEPECDILELGCGSGSLWQENAHRLPSGWNITLSDLSSGMLDDAKRALEEVPHAFTFEVIDAQLIPFPDESFDCVIANHMLFHVPELNKALSGIARILKSTGRLHASTVGSTHLRELREIVARFVPDWVGPPKSFLLENGKAELERYFADVQVDRYEDVLVVTDPQALFDYICSMGSVSEVPESVLSDLNEFLRTEIRRKGKISITKDSGIFTAKTQCLKI